MARRRRARPRPPATAAPATTAAATGDAATHALIDEFGEVEVPVAPQRVVFMDATTLGNAVALGFPADRIAGVAFGAHLDPAPSGNATSPTTSISPPSPTSVNWPSPTSRRSPPSIPM